MATTTDTVYCDLHQRYDCKLCDECGHEQHLWAPALEAEGKLEAAQFVYDHATCWAENICADCNPALYAQAVAL